LLIYVRQNVKLNKIVQKKKSSNLPMDSESLTLTSNLLTGYYSRQQPSSLRLGDVIFLGERSVTELSGFAFFSKTSARICAKFFFRV